LASTATGGCPEPLSLHAFGEPLPFAVPICQMYHFPSASWIVCGLWASCVSAMSCLVYGPRIVLDVACATVEPPDQPCRPQFAPPISVTKRCHCAVWLSQMALPPHEVVAKGTPNP
jgi:hypothetical protein